jgi:hypothetical protein
MASKFACDTTLEQAPAFQTCRAGPRSEIRVLVAELRAFLGALDQEVFQEKLVSSTKIKKVV